MYSPHLEVLNQVVTWLETGQSVALATVAETWGSSPRPVGSLFAIASEGQFIGSVSGGCIENDIVAQVQSGKLSYPQQLTYGITDEQGRAFGLLCGGHITLVIEWLNTVDTVKPAIDALQKCEAITRYLDLASGQVVWSNIQQNFSYDKQQLICCYGPTWRLLLIGAVQISRYLAEYALTLDYQIVVCDPRKEYRSSWNLPHTQLDNQMPDDAVKYFVQDAHSAVIALTHDPKLDDLALLAALETPAFYIGALGSKASQSKRRERFIQMGIAETAITRLHAPVGLAIGSRTPPEIAIAILADLIKTRNQPIA